ncbi:hypothetical protein GRI43_11820 [Altererythrobacter luteolus]|uniref:Uncharacterized protein n=1 Tax=Pontixanthobacter luteolus TaxID=295089 RepID=A0A6I4V2D7_9SPHN|nr:hypothetical protein [Pontixanthobacter luteolus]MXP48073.1 hypothetical protein [Pontixanthobacter luteolus]
MIKAKLANSSGRLANRLTAAAAAAARSVAENRLRARRRDPRRWRDARLLWPLFARTD